MIRRWQPLACLALVAGTTSCIDLSVDPAEVASIEFVAPANPSLVRGDTLVDTLGRADRLVARVYTADGDLVADAPVYFVATDTLVKVVNGNRIVAADTTGTSKVYAVSGQLQSIARSLSIIRRPDSIAFNGTGPDTLRLRPPTAGTAIDTSKSVAVTVRAGTGSATPVRVKFELLRRGVLLAPGDTGTYALVSSGRAYPRSTPPMGAESRRASCACAPRPARRSPTPSWCARRSRWAGRSRTSRRSAPS
ncbi:MAG: hypothetical protein IPN16_08820 [Gemmatimonadetes bacterium]|nr:hypothetical protein [Gemmatimonadota bacterium]